jgi:hypothetical protein
VSSPEQVLPRPQRNDLFRALEKSGAPVSDFRLQAGSDSVPWLIVYHDSSQSSFLIQIHPHHFAPYGFLGNGDSSMGEDEKFQRYLNVVSTPELLGFHAAFADILPWEKVVPVVEKWALEAVRNSREDEETPDLWTEFRHSQQAFSASFENTPFTEVERQQVSVHIQQIKTYITTTYELSADQRSEVNERLDQIDEASRRLGRKDWLMAFTGAVFSLVLSDLIPQQAAQHILTLTLHGLGHLFGFGGTPPHLPPAG